MVGISTAIATNGGGEANAGVGFAIPIDEALEVARSLVKHRPVDLPFLGVEADIELTPEIADRYRLATVPGRWSRGWRRAARRPRPGCAGET